jgi:hypothetical protein
LANKDWWDKNTGAVKEMLPKTWTHMENINGMRIGFAMKLIGIDWRNENDFGRVMIFFERIGIMQRQNVYQLRVNPHWEFTPEMFDNLSS